MAVPDFGNDGVSIAIVAELKPLAPPPSDDISVCTHLSSDRLDRLALISARWGGPIVAAVLVDSVSAFEAVRSDLPQRPHVHIIACVAQGGQYPANHLRNVAQRAAATDFVFILDVDLIPDDALYPDAVAIAQEALRPSDKLVLIPAAFDFIRGDKEEEPPPSSWGALLLSLKRGSVQPILNDTFPAAFSCLNYAALLSKHPAGELFFETTYSWPCEPYVIARREGLPPFDERFVDYGNDKAQHALELHNAGYSFHVIRRHFLFHWPHQRAEWAKPSVRDAALPKVLELTEKFQWESGTKRGKNWKTGGALPVGTYRVKDGRIIIWTGEKVGQ